MPAVLSVNISRTKGVRKESVPAIRLRLGHGVEGDAHAGDWHRQGQPAGPGKASTRCVKGGLDLQPGDFAENITTTGLDVPLPSRRHAPAPRFRGDRRTDPDRQGNATPAAPS